VNGAESLVRTLVEGGVDVCFTNPGTSEMHFVAALDRVEGMRCVLGLFEGVVTGAADGYGRMTGRPASTLLHLGPGLANGLANLHNASKALTPIVNIVGDHATYHLKYDAPLTADIEGIARPYSKWLKTSPSSRTVAADGAAAIAAALTPPGQIATLILPADTAWNDADGTAPVPAVPARARVEEATIRKLADKLKSGGPVAFVLNGPRLRAKPLETCGRVAATLGADLLSPTGMPRVERGAGRVNVDRIPYVIEMATERLKHIRTMVLVNAQAPVAFFAYPDKPSLVTHPDCEIVTLAGISEDGIDAMERLADLIGAGATQPKLEPLQRPEPATGQLTPPGIARSIAALLPENAIVVDESVTSGRGLVPATRNAPPHDWLVNPGGSIGMAMPVAIGAAIACPDRKVICLQGDGSAMYTLQSLWTMAREKLDIVTLIFANRTYAILKGELMNVGAGNPGRKALDMLEIGRPDLDWVKLAEGHGVPAARVETLEELNRQLAAALRQRGPYFIEVAL